MVSRKIVRSRQVVCKGNKINKNKGIQDYCYVDNYLKSFVDRCTAFEV